MEIREFIGTWKNKAGNILEIEPNDKSSLKVSFFSGINGKPIIREYSDNKESLDMLAELDYIKTSLEVELWEKGKGFQLCLGYICNDFDNETNKDCLAPGISIYEGDRISDKFMDLFGPLYNYKRLQK